jgi:hypothetical protein
MRRFIKRHFSSFWDGFFGLLAYGPDSLQDMDISVHLAADGFKADRAKLRGDWQAAYEKVLHEADPQTSEALERIRRDRRHESSFAPVRAVSH